MPVSLILNGDDDDDDGDDGARYKLLGNEIDHINNIQLCLPNATVADQNPWDDTYDRNFFHVKQYLVDIYSLMHKNLERKFC